MGAKRAIAAASKFTGKGDAVILIYGFSGNPRSKLLTTSIASWAPCFYMLQFIRNNSFE